jgi:hypothetical protein
MLKAGSVMALVLALSGSIVVHAQISGVPPSIFYDTFMQQNVEDRVRTFKLISPAQRRDVVREQIMRWIYVNRSWLTPEQRSVLEDFLYFVEPNLFVVRPDPDITAKAKEMMTRAAALFSNAQIRQALTIYGDYIPPQP